MADGNAWQPKPPKSNKDLILANARPRNDMEEIAAAAARVGNTIYTGMTHSAAMNKIAETPGLDSAAIAKMF